MGFLDSLTDLMGWSNSNAQEALNGATVKENLGNVYLPGGVQGGSVNTSPFANMGGAGGGYGNSPLSQADWQAINPIWGNIRRAANYNDINWKDPSLKGASLSPEASQYLQNNWGNVRRAANFGDINWKDPSLVGSPGYKQAPGGAGGATAGQGMPGSSGGSPSTLGDLEPGRAAFAGAVAPNVADSMTNNQPNILAAMRASAAPGEQRAWNSTNDNLFSRGRLGANDSATGEAYRGYQEGVQNADLNRQVASYGLGDQLQTDALNRGLGAAGGAGGLTQLSTLPFQLALQLAQANASSQQGIAGSAANQNDNIMDSWSKFWGGSGGNKGSSTGGFFSNMSDYRLKKNVEYVGKRRGRNWYTWDWIDGGKGQGVMAHENLDIAEVHPSGFLAVDYSKV
jgi:hypothetical protein